MKNMLYHFLTIFALCEIIHSFQLLSTPGRSTIKSRCTQPLFVETPSSLSQQQLQEEEQANIPAPLSSASPRRIESIERFARLPVWPVWNGVAIFVVSRLLGKDIAARLEDAIGGRVCPNFFNPPERTSPFIMLVHHRHSFAVWDPLRYIQRTFFPEGFPAHPHRGFITVTYFLRGGFLHRDSMGIKQTYGAEERHNGKHTQYLMTGAGLLHEEMYDIQPNNAFGVSGQELYQLWLNVPASNKMDDPFVQLLGGEDETPTVMNEIGNVATIVLAGNYQGKQSTARIFSDVSIFHVKMGIYDDNTSKGKKMKWEYMLPTGHATCILYLRTGTVTVDGQDISAHNTIFFQSSGAHLVVESQEGADFMFLSGEPLNEPVAAQGSMVMNSGNGINQAYSDYQAGMMGAPWEHTLSDEEWKQHNTKFPNIYSSKR